MNDNQHVEKSEVNKIRKGIRRGDKIPPIDINDIDHKLKKKYFITDPHKKYSIANGFHRFAAHKAEGKRTILAIKTYARKVK